MYSLADKDIFEIQIVGRLHGQETRNVFHYYVATSAPIADGRAALVAAGNDFLTRVYQRILAFQSQEWTCTAVTVQKISPVRYRLIKITPSDLIGDIEENSLPSTSAAVISRYCEEAGRSFQGRIFIPGVPVTFEEDSLVNAEGMGYLESIVPHLYEQLTIGGGAAGTPTLSKGAHDPSTQVVSSAVATDVLRVQRRREVGRGS